MKLKYLFYLVLLINFSSCKKQVIVQKNKDVAADVVLQTAVKSYSFKELKPFLEHKDDKIYVVNFWATWCAPCVKELPYFEDIRANYKESNVEVLLVSLDFPKQIKKRLIPFIEKQNLQAKVVVLDDVDEDVWIKAIDKNWSGALPATLIYNKNKRKFYEQSFDYKTLENELKTFLN